MGYREDRAWSDRFIPYIKRIVGPLLLEPAPLEMDAVQATDLIVFRARDMRIAARVRREIYAERYPWEFTIRSHRDSGAQTELTKIIDGWGDWFFYGYAQGEDGIGRWMIIDLDAFRAGLIRRSQQYPIKREERSNGDGTHFYAFNVRSFPPVPSILIAANYAMRKEVSYPVIDAEQLGFDFLRAAAS